MTKKQNKRKNNARNSSSAAPSSTAPIVRRLPEIPVFWLAVIIPIVCLVGAWTFPPVATPMELKSYTSQIYLSGLLLAWFWMLRKHPRLTLTFSPGRICFGLLFIAGTLSLVWASNPDFWVYKWNKWFVGFVMFFMGVQITQNVKNLDTVVNLAILGGLIVASIGIAQYLFNFNGVPQTSFPSSTFGNGNMAGQVMVLTAILPLYFLFKENLSKGKTWFYALSITVLFTYVFYTRTRAVWIACIFEACLIFIFIVFDKARRKEWLNWNTEKTKAAAFACCAFALLINVNGEGFNPFWEVAINELSSIAVNIGGSANESGGERYLIWTSAFNIFKDYPIIGAGLGNFFEAANNGVYLNYRILGVQRVHNDVLEIAVELGVLGLTLLLIIIGTMCTLIYKLILRSSGNKRILFAVLIIASTGSMLNAQLSFPYQLPVPLLIMPFFMALVIRGSEDLEENSFTIACKPWFNKAALSLSSIVFIFFTVNDLFWMRDIHQLNQIVSGKITTSPWTPVNPIYNQAYITAARSVAQAIRVQNNPELSLRVMKAPAEYWPNTLAHQTIMAENYLLLGDFDQAEYWSKKMATSQMRDVFFSEFYLMDVYQRKGDLEKYREIYESLKIKPESSLSQHPNSYNMLHSMSINLQDFENTTYYFNKYLEYFGEFAPVLANQSIFYLTTGVIPEAIPLMRRALELNPQLPRSNEFRQYIAQYPEY